MARRVKEFKVKIEGWDGKFRAIDRFVVRADLSDSSRSSYLSDCGFRSDAINNADDVYGVDDLSQLKGGLIVGSGDSGKTVLLGELASRLKGDEGACRILKMRDLGRSTEKLSSELMRINRASVPCVLIDGLDELPDGADILVNAIRAAKKQRRWWITSRPIPELQKFDCIRDRVPRMSILPFSYREANDVANWLVGCGTSFMQSVQEVGLLDFCTQPGGLIALLRVYQNGHFEGVSTKNVVAKIAEDYCSQRKDGNIYEQIKDAGEQSARLVDTLGWMAACLVLTKNDEFWLWDRDKRPPHTLSLRDCVTERYGYDELFTALTARAIEPMGEHRVRFSYAPLMCYLCANWLHNNVALENASTLLRVAAPRNEGQILDTQLWLSRLDERYKPQGMELAPEHFLRSKSAIADIGFDKYYNLLESRFGKLTFDERQDVIVKWLSVLSAFDVEPVVRRKLNDADSSVGIEFAAVVARQCKLRNCLASMIDVVADQTLSVTLRSSVSYNLLWFKEQFPNAGEFVGLFSLVNTPFRGVEESNIVGNALDCLWPGSISAKELCKTLQKPFRQGYFGAYERFVDYSFPASFSKHLDQSSTVDVLLWAKGHIAETRPFERLGRLARSVFTYAWKWVACSEVASAMRECLLAYMKSAGHHQLPFIDKEPGDDRYGWSVTPRKFAKDSKRRMSLLKTIVEDDRFSDHDLEGLGMWFERFPLYSAADFNLIYEEWAKCISGDSHRAQRWSVVLGQIVLQMSKHIDGQRLKRLSAAYPQNNNFNRKCLDARIRRSLRYQRSQQKERMRAETKASELRERVVLRVKKLLANSDDTGFAFVNISYLMPSEDGRPVFPEMDVTATANYGKLGVEERRALLAAAETTLAILPDDIINEGGQNTAVLSGVAFVWRKNRRFFASLSNTRIGVLSHCIFSSYYSAGGVAIFSEIMTEFILRAREECFAAMKVVMAKDASRGLSPGNVLRLWKSDLNRGEVDSLFRDFATASGVAIGQIVEQIASIEGGAESVRRYLSKFIPLKNKRCIADSAAPLLVYALRLFPAVYGPYLLNLAKNNCRWTKKWLLSVSLHSDETAIADAILKSGERVAFEFFVWLERNFPECKRPAHDAVYSPSATDNVYEIKDLIITGLMNNCTEGTLKLLIRLPRLLPSRPWDYLLIRCRSKVENDAVPEAIPLEELKRVQIKPKITQADNTGQGYPKPSMPPRDIRLMIRDGSDLRDAVLRSIRMYGTSYLHDGTFAAFPDVWNDIRESMVRPKRSRTKDCILSAPKDEERFSDHLARYLQSELDDVAVTREDQSGPSYPTKTRGKKSAYHDISIFHTKTKAKVIVEVKGNWNKDLRRKGLVDQLQNDYLKRNKTAYGIFVCGCFSSECWCNGDWRRSVVKGFATKNEAQKSLDEQLSQLDFKERISVIAIDCSYGP